MMEKPFDPSPLTDELMDEMSEHYAKEAERDSQKAIPLKGKTEETNE